MRNKTIRIIATILCIVLFVTVVPTEIANVPVFAKKTASQIKNEIADLEDEADEIQDEINDLQGKINEQKALKDALEKKIANLQEQIDICNAAIDKLNAQISKYQKEIEESEAKIEADKLAFRKRLRAIYMSNSGSNLQILLGAENFSDFLYLAELTASVSARDKILIEGLVANIQSIEKKQAEIDAMLDEQIEIKKTIDEKQTELEKESAAIQKVINGIDADQTELEKDKASVEAQIKKKEQQLAELNTTGGTDVKYDGGQFLWPVPGYYGISSGYGSRWGTIHRGIDIAGGGISGKKVVAVADGVIVKHYNSCKHNYGKSGSCGCGGGYGNYITINHGTKDGKTYLAIYAHLSRTALSGGTVKKGQTIGYVGSTGWSTGFHLHYGISVNGSWVNPMNYY